MYDECLCRWTLPARPDAPSAPTTRGPPWRRPARSAARRSPPIPLATCPGRKSSSDEALQDLIRTALENNYDLRVAVTRVEQARAVAFQARADFFPQVTYNALADRGRNSIFGQPITSSAAAGKTLNSFLVGLDASWEIDLWGRIRRSNESAQAQLMASEEARRGVLVTLVGDVAQAYYELLELDLELGIAQRSTVSFAAEPQTLPGPVRGGRRHASGDQPRRGLAGHGRRHHSRPGAADPHQGEPDQHPAGPTPRPDRPRRNAPGAGLAAAGAGRPSVVAPGAAARHPPGRAGTAVLQRR